MITYEYIDYCFSAELPLLLSYSEKFIVKDENKEYIERADYIFLYWIA